MQAIVLQSFGGPEQLRVAEVEVPDPSPAQVRVRVRAVGVNPVDAKIRSGAMEAAFPTPLPTILGTEFAGVVDAVGERVEGVKVGDAVVGWADPPDGSYAEFALASTLTSKPDALAFEEAVTLPVAGRTAGRVLDELGVSAGETLLIHGAAGAVGTVAVQLAVQLGATVIGTAGPGNQDYVRSLGALATTYGPGLVARVRELAPNGVDAVFDVAGQGAIPDSIELRGGTERIVTIADFSAPSRGVPFSRGGADDVSNLPELLAQAVAGAMRTTIAATFPLAEAEQAQRLTEAGHARGKVVLTVP
jgi:NADPH:quinone reductase-like Zn-dependent oxidoreductase